jgi:A/G-specific adenine glycosylase
VTWQRKHGRRGLPWQGTRDPYRIWVSEIMLQQTQVATVVPFYERFVARFPDVALLARAPVDDVMRLWSGLGYYARARNLHRAAKAIADIHGGRFPLSLQAVRELPGIGRSTAAAIVAFATGEPHAILDGNVKRVLARHFGIEGPVDSQPVVTRLWEIAQSLLPSRGIEVYTQALMDLGATVCTRASPACTQCPVRRSCAALRDGRVGELPGARASRPVPTRRTAMLVIVSRGEVLVEKRPLAGIWGGLWSLPEAPADADPGEWCEREFGQAVADATPLPPFTHGFTHFRLEVTPWLLRTRKAGERAGERATMWLPLQEVPGAALPAPVKKLLCALAAAPSRPGAARAGNGAAPKGARRGR